jgi:hypothetical protein
MKNYVATTLPVGIALGAGIGTSLGVAMHNIAIWLPLGIAIGSSLGVVFGLARSRRNQNPG